MSPPQVLDKKPSPKNTLRRDSVRPRTDSTTEVSTKTLLISLNLLILAIAALQKSGETPTKAKTPARAETIGRLINFARDAWDEETFNAELEKAGKQLPTLGAVEGAAMCVGLWLSEAVRVLRQGELERDAADLEAVCMGLQGEKAEATGEGRRSMDWKFGSRRGFEDEAGGRLGK